ncbi:hypothetical protein BLNAU_13218 [Blattamonas nauphoetae]|uniref:Uncharacterized protein n=1 Tax=Blattamonas nauphoetae TaxID=2049346 RepID=A0ABQ9XHC5_9EUKA|nr:hypothetical protein BLNAU_13218 [Blattamonas nauphoetae]
MQEPSPLKLLEHKLYREITLLLSSSEFSTSIDFKALTKHLEAKISQSLFYHQDLVQGIVQKLRNERSDNSSPDKSETQDEIIFQSTTPRLACVYTSDSANSPPSQRKRRSDVETNTNLPSDRAIQAEIIRILEEDSSSSAISLKNLRRKQLIEETAMRLRGVSLVTIMKIRHSQHLIQWSIMKLRTLAYRNYTTFRSFSPVPLVPAECEADSYQDFTAPPVVRTLFPPNQTVAQSLQLNGSIGASGQPLDASYLSISPIRGIDINPVDASKFVVAKEDCAHIYDHVYQKGSVQTEECSCELTSIMHRPTSAFEIAAGGINGIIRLFDVRVKENLRISFTADTNTKPYSAVKVWGLRNAHSSGIQSVAWHRYIDYWLASTGTDGIVHIWDLRAGSPKTPVFSLNCLPSLSSTCPYITHLSWSTAFPDLLAASSPDRAFMISFTDSSSPYHIPVEWDFSESPYLPNVGAKFITSPSPTFVSCCGDKTIRATTLTEAFLNVTIPNILSFDSDPTLFDTTVTQEMIEMQMKRLKQEKQSTRDNEKRQRKKKLTHITDGRKTIKIDHHTVSELDELADSFSKPPFDCVFEETLSECYGIIPATFRKFGKVVSVSADHHDDPDSRHLPSRDNVLIASRMAQMTSDALSTINEAQSASRQIWQGQRLTPPPENLSFRSSMNAQKSHSPSSSFRIDTPHSSMSANTPHPSQRPYSVVRTRKDIQQESNVTQAVFTLLTCPLFADQIRELVLLLRQKNFSTFFHDAIVVLQETTDFREVMATRMVLALFTPVSTSQLVDLPFSYIMNLLSFRMCDQYPYSLSSNTLNFDSKTVTTQYKQVRNIKRQSAKMDKTTPKMLQRMPSRAVLLPVYMTNSQSSPLSPKTVSLSSRAKEKIAAKQKLMEERRKVKESETMLVSQSLSLPQFTFIDFIFNITTFTFIHLVETAYLCHLSLKVFSELKSPLLSHMFQDHQYLVWLAEGNRSHEWVDNTPPVNGITLDNMILIGSREDPNKTELSDDAKKVASRFCPSVFFDLLNQIKKTDESLFFEWILTLCRFFWQQSLHVEQSVTTIVRLALDPLLVVRCDSDPIFQSLPPPHIVTGLSEIANSGLGIPAAPPLLATTTDGIAAFPSPEFTPVDDEDPFGENSVPLFIPPPPPLILNKVSTQVVQGGNIPPPPRLPSDLSSIPTPPPLPLDAAKELEVNDPTSLIRKTLYSTSPIQFIQEINILARMSSAQPPSTKQIALLYPHLPLTICCGIVTGILESLVQIRKTPVALVGCLIVKKRLEKCDPVPTYSAHLVRFFEETVCSSLLSQAIDLVGELTHRDLDEKETAQDDDDDDDDRRGHDQTSSFMDMQGDRSSFNSPVGIMRSQGFTTNNRMSMRLGGGLNEMVSPISTQPPTMRARTFRGVAQQMITSKQTKDPLEMTKQRCSMLQDLSQLYLILNPLPEALKTLPAFLRRLLASIRAIANQNYTASLIAGQMAEEIDKTTDYLNVLLLEGQKHASHRKEQGILGLLESRMKERDDPTFRPQKGDDQDEEEQTHTPDYYKAITREKVTEQDWNEWLKVQTEISRKKPENTQLFASQYFTDYYTYVAVSKTPKRTIIDVESFLNVRASDFHTLPECLSPDYDATGAESAPELTIDLEPFTINGHVTIIEYIVDRLTNCSGFLRRKD